MNRVSAPAQDECTHCAVSAQEFTRFFLETCIDQVRFKESLVQPERLRARILVWANEEIVLGALPAQAVRLLEAVLHRGELPRGEVDEIARTGER